MEKEIISSTKTKQKIQEAFLNLCIQKGLSKITISAVTKKAGCNRCTFYNYYDDINDLITETEDNLIKQLQKKIYNIHTTSKFPQDVNVIFPKLLTTFEEYGDIIYTLLSEKGDPTFRNKLKQVTISYFNTKNFESSTCNKMDYIFCYAISAWTGLIEHWYETGREDSPKDFLHLSQTLVANGLLGTIKKSNK